MSASRLAAGHFFYPIAIMDEEIEEASISGQLFLRLPKTLQCKLAYIPVGVIMDISERKVAAEQLLQADKMASLGRMISGTAHELN